MVDFAVGEPIRLLPCMHFYHMRCIDEWLLRSYCCPSCMERVDVGMVNTLTSASSPAHVGLRRRRRRRDRGSSSSVASLVGGNAGPGGRGVEEGAKRREGTQFVPVSRQSSGQTISGQAVFPSGPYHTGQGVEVPSGQAACPPGRTAAVPSGQGHMNYLTDLSISGHSSGHSSSGQVEGASGGYDQDVQLLNHPDLTQLSQDDLAYSMDQITFSDFQVASRGQSSQGAEYSGGIITPSDVGVATSPRFSPPVFEYHFEYPPSPTPPTNDTQQ